MIDDAVGDHWTQNGHLEAKNINNQLDISSKMEMTFSESNSACNFNNDFPSG